MPRLILSRRAVADLQRCREFLAERDAAAAVRAAGAIASGLRLLTITPQAGRPVQAEPAFRELVIPFGATDYVALYAFDRDKGAATILAIRHQREAGY